MGEAISTTFNVVDNMSPAFRSMASALNQVIAGVEAVGKGTDGLNSGQIDAMRSAVREADAAFADMSGNVDRAKRSMQAAEAAAQKLGKAGSTISSVGKGMQTLGKAASVVTTGLTTITAASGKTALSFVKLYESTNIVFEKMLGSKAAADDMYAGLLKVAKASTFSQETFLNAGKSLVGVGVSAENTEKYLQAISDAVTAFGGNSQNVEQTADAFKKIATNGRLSMEEINMLSDNGIQALKILGNQYGKSTSDIRDMISDGALPAEEALAKLTDGIENGTDGVNGMTAAMNGMANAMKGKTITGALDSMHSSFRTFALSLVGMNPTLKETDAGYAESKQRIAQLTAALSTINSIIPKTAALFTGITDGIGNMLNKLVGTNVVFDETTGQWQNVGGILGDLNAKLSAMNPEKLHAIGKAILGIAAAGPPLLIAGKAFAGLGESIERMSKSKEVLEGFLKTKDSMGSDGPFGKMFASMGKGVSNFGGTLASAFGSVGSAASGKLSRVFAGMKSSGIGTALDGVTSVFKQKLSGLLVTSDLYMGMLKDGIASKMSTIGGAFGGILPKIGFVGSAFLGAVPGLGAFGVGAAGVLAAIGALVGGLGLLNQNGAGEAFITNLTNGIVNGMPVLRQKAVDAINGFVQSFMNNFPTIAGQGLALIQTLANGIVAALPVIISQGIQILSAIGSGIMQMLPTLIDCGVQTIMALVNGFIQVMPVVLQQGMVLIMSLANGLIQNLPTIIDCGIQAVTSLALGLIQALPILIPQAINLILSLADMIVQNLPTIIDAGVQIIASLAVGLITAIPQIVVAMGQAVLKIGQTLVDSCPDIKAKAMQIGTNLVNGLKEGFFGAWENVKNTITGGFGGMIDNIKNVLGIHSPSTETAGIASNMVAGLQTGFDDNMPQAVAVITDKMDYLAKMTKQKTDALVVGITAQYATLANTLQAEVTSMTDKLNAQWQTLASTSIRILTNFATAMVQSMQTLVSGVNTQWNLMLSITTARLQAILTVATISITQMVDNVTKRMATLPPFFMSTSNAMMNNLNAGIVSNQAKVLKSTDDLVQKLMDTFITGLGIHSPSKVMYWIGQMMIAGLINGMDSSKVTGFTEATIGKMKDSFANGKFNAFELVDALGDNVPALVAKLGVDPAQAAATLAYPLLGTAGTLTSVFGGRDAPTEGASTNHGGIDLAAPTGTPIVSVLPGTVTVAGGYGGYGNAVRIDHGGGLESLYGHMSSVGTAVGSQVTAGQTIGAVGSTGISTGPHLHLSMFQNGEAIDPLPYVQGAPIMAGNTLAGTIMAAYNLKKYGISGDVGTWMGADGADAARQYIAQALALTGQPMSLLNGLMYAAYSESGYNPNAINLWDSNAAAGHPSKGMFQTIDSTFSAYALPGMNDIWNPVHNAVAAIRYMIDRYGSVANVVGPRMGNWYGYATGTNNARKGLAWVGENGPEIVDFGGGETVYTNRESRNIVSGMAEKSPFDMNAMALTMAQNGAGTAAAGDIHIDITNNINNNGDLDNAETTIYNVVTRALRQENDASTGGIHGF